MISPSASAPSPEPDPLVVPLAERIAAALALLDGIEALYRSGHHLQLLNFDGKVVRLRAMAQTAARTIPIVKV
jgi:hypothetical protein